MKKFMAIICLVIFSGIFNPGFSQVEENIDGDHHLLLRYSPDLYQLSVAFKDAYAVLHPEMNLELLPLDKALSDQIDLKSGQVAILGKSDLDAFASSSSRMNVIGKEIYVPVINKYNPFLEEIQSQGLSPEDFSLLFSSEEDVTWGMMLKNGSPLPVHPCRVSGPSFEKHFTDFTGVEIESGKERIFPSCNELLKFVQIDKNAIGFCSMNQLKTLSAENEKNELAFVPIDLNNNKQIDHFENIFGSVDELSRGIWIGKYSAALYSKVYALSSIATAAEEEQKFIKWLSIDGQKIVAELGYTPLMEREQKAVLASFENEPGLTVSSPMKGQQTSSALLLVFVAAGLGLVFTFGLLIRNKKANDLIITKKRSAPSIHTTETEIPAGYFFDRTHTWSFLERDGSIRIGIDSFLQKVTGKITRVDLRSPGEKVRKGESIGLLIQNGKRLEIKSPISGVIRQLNSNLTAQAHLINSSPFSEGWIYLIEPLDWYEESTLLFRAQKYNEWIKLEFARLKDFLASIIQTERQPGIVLQDGGELSDGVLANLGPKVWEEFQTEFLKN